MLGIPQKKKRQIVLLGAGTAHLPILKKWSMDPIPETELILVNETSCVLYSGMVPGMIAGMYQEDELKIDLVRFCARYGIEFIKAEVEKIDTESKTIHLKDRSPLSFGLLSINLGSQPQKAFETGIKTLPLKPFAKLQEALKDLDQSGGTAKKIAVIGAGAGGCEIALALKKRYPLAGVEIYSKSPAVIHNYTKKNQAAMLQALEKAGIHVSFNPFLPSYSTHLDKVVWTTDAIPVESLRLSTFPKDERGFIRVGETLEVEAHPGIFAVGDSASFPRSIAKSGVYAVREAETLWRNLKAFVAKEKLVPYRPQPRFLSLLNTADGEALFNYGSISTKSKWALKLKDRIDKKWIQKFEVRALPSEIKMVCGGCGSKVPSQVLRRVFDRLGIKDVVGEDAAISPEVVPNQIQLQTVDLLKCFTSDLFVFGEIAAVHALNDLYAMNAKAQSALAVLTLPESSEAVTEQKLYDLLSGALKVFKREGVALIGGHTTTATDFTLGFSVSGSARPEAVFRKDGLKAGDVLFLTKPLGSGALLAALMRGECRAEWYDALIASMKTSNRAATQVFSEFGVKAATDVTGFGLYGHLWEMLDKSGVSAELSARLPTFSGVDQVFQTGIFATIHDQNRAAFEKYISGNLSQIGYDPQTAGGVLAGVDPSVVTAIESAFEPQGVGLWKIGNVVPRQVLDSQIKSTSQATA